jgi:hypothetical protein
LTSKQDQRVGLTNPINTPDANSKEKIASFIVDSIFRDGPLLKGRRGKLCSQCGEEEPIFEVNRKIVY